VYGQQYAADGTTLGTEFRVNTATNYYEQQPSVTALSSGGFVVTWTSYGQDGSGYGVYGQRYAADGTTLGTEFRVNTATYSDQFDPSVTALSSGGFVVTWTSYDQDGSASGVYGQRYAADGNVVGSEFLINTTTNNSQEQPSVTALSSGGFIITWSGNGDVYSKIIADGVDSDVSFNLNLEQNLNLTGTNDIDGIGNNLNNMIIGNSGDNDIYGLADNDFLVGGAGNDYISGGVDNDTIFGDAGDDILVDQSGTNTFYGGDGNDIIVGGLENDTIYGDKGNDIIYGRAGTNTIYGGAGDNTIYGGDDGDTIYADSNNGEQIVLPGNNYISAGAGNDFIDGADGNDFISGADGIDEINGGNGNDIIIGGNGNDTIYGNTLESFDYTEINYLYGDAGDDTIVGAAGNDIIFGGTGNDNINGSNGNDLIYGGDGIDNIYGDDGSDIISGGAGADLLSGGAGDDFVYGGDDNNILNGDAGDDRLDGGAGDDRLVGGAGDDKLVGAAGNDTYDFNVGVAAGSDILYEETGGGTDTLRFFSEGDGVPIDLEVNGVSIDLSVASAQTVNTNLVLALNLQVENVAGTNYNDFIAGNAQNNLFTGNAGNDTFAFGNPFITLLSQLGVDQITDFTVGADRIQLSQSVFSAFTGTALAATDVSIVTDDAAAVAGIISYNSTNGKLFYDQTQFAELSTGLNLTNSDFTLLTLPVT
jgi:Ca2+-binding RTX toxin-like protein